MPKMTVILEPEEKQAVLDLAYREKRPSALQLAYILRQWLERENLLPNAAATGPARPQAAVRSE